MESQFEFMAFKALSQWITLWPSVLLFVLIGVFCLKYGADWLVEGSANIGFRFGISATMIGLTIVAFGTSAPELVVSLMTASQGRPEICLGNVIGSNIANTSLILGTTALVFPLKIQSSSIRFDGPISFIAIGMLFVLALMGGNVLSRLDGLIMLTVFGVWMGLLIRTSRKQAAESAAAISEGEEEVVFHARSVPMDIFLIFVGLIALVIGAKFLVAGAVKTAEALGIPDIVVGLTVVAGGTSLPELAVCLAAALKRHADITVGNVLGSNIFNAWLIMGTALVVEPIVFHTNGFSWTGDAGTLFIDIPFCVLLCGLLIPMMRHRQSLGRGKGLILLCAYVVYITSLVVRNLA